MEVFAHLLIAMVQRIKTRSFILSFLRNKIMHVLVLFTKWLVFAELLAAVTGLFTWHKWKYNYIRWLPIYLLFIGFLEIGFYFFSYTKQLSVAYFIHEVQSPFEILFISWFFYKTLNTKNRSIILVGAAIYIAALTLEKTLFQNNTYYFQSLSYTIGNLFILIYLIIY